MVHLKMKEEQVNLLKFALIDYLLMVKVLDDDKRTQLLELHSKLDNLNNIINNKK